MPASLSWRTAATITPCVSRTATVTSWPGVLRGLVGHRRQHLGGARGVRGRLEAHLQALAAEPVLELVRRALGDQLPVVDHRDVVGEAIGLVQVLGRQQRGRPAGDETLDHAPQAEAAARVEAGRGLVQEQHGRFGDERRAPRSRRRRIPPE